MHYVKDVILPVLPGSTNILKGCFSFSCRYPSKFTGIFIGMYRDVLVVKNCIHDQALSDSAFVPSFPCYNYCVYMSTFCKLRCVINCTSAHFYKDESLLNLKLVLKILLCNISQAIATGHTDVFNTMLGGLPVL